MLQVFTKLADWAVALMGLDSSTKLGTSVHFFIEDIVKIFVLIYVLIFVISLFRSQLSADKIRTYLSGKNRWYGYLLAVFFRGSNSVLFLFVYPAIYRVSSCRYSVRYHNGVFN